MQIKDLLRNPATQEELSLDTIVYTTVTTCCDREWFEPRIYEEEGDLFIDYNIGSCRKLGSATQCENLYKTQRVFKHLANILTPEQKADILTLPDSELREILTPFLRT